MADTNDYEESESEQEYDSDVNTTTDEEDEGEDLVEQAADGGEADVPPAQIAVRGQAPYQFEPLARVNNNQQLSDDEEEIDYEQRLDNVDW